MTSAPIFCVTHPRACSTAFERIFMTRTDDMTCLHEPFGDAFYYGPERMSRRFEHDENGRATTGFSDSTYKTIFDRIENEQSQGKRVFIKDIIYYLFPTDGKPAQIAPSLLPKKRGIGTEVACTSNGATNGATNGNVNGHGGPPFPYGTAAEAGNPTVVPNELLKKFHFTFLIRDPHYSIPSYWRCTIPPLDDVTGFYEFYPNESGYDEVRRMFDYLVASGKVGPGIARNAEGGEAETNVNQNGSVGGQAEICVVDADDLLDNPAGIMQAYCRSVGLEYKASMLKWDTEELQSQAKAQFEKWPGFHDDAINSKDLKPRVHKKAKKTEAEYDQEWTQKYGLKAAAVIRQTVDDNMPIYRYLKQFALQV